MHKPRGDTCIEIPILRTWIPERIISDNGPQYDSYAFKQFAKDWGFDHIISSPTYAQSNGFIERTIQTVKKNIKKGQRQQHRYRHGITVFENNTNQSQPTKSSTAAVQKNDQRKPPNKDQEHTS